MKHYDIVKPIGLAALCEEVETNCKKAYMYKRCGLRPSHLIVPLDAGSGRTTFIEYMTDMYKENGVLDFASGLDDYIEITLDGSLAQLKQVFAAIEAAAVYANDYSGIIGMDISSISAHLNETQLTEFLASSAQVCDHACVVFFLHSVPSRNEERLMEKLCESVENIKRMDVEPYTSENMRDLIIKRITEYGIVVEHEQAFRSILLDMVTECGIMSVKEAISMAEALVRYADFSDFVPRADENSLKALMRNRNNGMKGREIK